MNDMNDPQDIIIAASNPDGDGLTLTLPWDTDLAGLADACRTIAFWLTFPASTIDDNLPDPTREWSYDDEPDEHDPEGDD